QVQPVAQPTAHGRRVDGDGGGRAALRLVHRDIGMLEHRRNVVAVVGIDGEPDARRGIELQALVLDGILEYRPAVLRDLNSQRPRVGMAQQNHELIATEAAYGDVLQYAFESLQRRGELAGDSAQHRVADTMAESV